MTAIGPGPHTGTVHVSNAASLDEVVALAADQIRSFLSDREFTLTTEAEALSIRTGDGTLHVVGWDVTVVWKFTP